MNAEKSMHMCTVLLKQSWKAYAKKERAKGSDKINIKSH